jgi:hypothetical protein
MNDDIDRLKTQLKTEKEISERRRAALQKITKILGGFFVGGNIITGASLAMESMIGAVVGFSFLAAGMILIGAGGITGDLYE